MSFKQKFCDKTHQEWDKRDRFQPQPGKYTMITVEQGQQKGTRSVNEEISQLNKRNEMTRQRIKTIPSKLDPQLQEILGMIWDLQKINNTLKELNFDTEKNPLGRLSLD